MCGLLSQFAIGFVEFLFYKHFIFLFIWRELMRIYFADEKIFVNCFVFKE